jgi:CBS domain-containing protein
VTAYAFTVLVMKRSILTEKLSRRGHHLSREYRVDPLEQMFVRQVMRTKTVVLPGAMTVTELAATLHNERGTRGQGLYPVVDTDDRLLGVVTRGDIDAAAGSGRALAEIARREAVVCFSDEPLRAVADRMAGSGVTRMPVLDGNETARVVSVISVRDLLQARTRAVLEERERERTLRVRAFARRPDRRPLQHSDAG